jgi:hypothetical protein
VLKADVVTRAASRLRAGEFTLGVRLTATPPADIARAASRLRAGEFTRRSFLGAAGVVLLGGCGADEARKEPPSDETVLRGLLDAELAAGAAVIGSPVAELLARQDMRHAARLAALAGVAAPGAPGDAVDLATGLARKQEAVFAYVAALPRLADPDARVAVLQILGSEAEHLAALRQRAGAQPVPDAFAGLTEAA